MWPSTVKSAPQNAAQSSEKPITEKRVVGSSPPEPHVPSSGRFVVSSTKCRNAGVVVFLCGYVLS